MPLSGIKVRACDIDTYGDYQRAIEFVKGWKLDDIEGWYMDETHRSI